MEPEYSASDVYVYTYVNDFMLGQEFLFFSTVLGIIVQSCSSAKASGN